MIGALLAALLSAPAPAAPEANVLVDLPQCVRSLGWGEASVVGPVETPMSDQELQRLLDTIEARRDSPGGWRALAEDCHRAGLALDARGAGGLAGVL